MSYEPDFTYVNYGSVWSIHARSKEAKAFARKHFEVPSWAGRKYHFVTDWRPASNLIGRLRDDEGFLVEDVT